MKKTLLAAAALSAFGMIGSAQAATLNGTFSVTAVNVTNLTSAQSQATEANFQNALNGIGGGNSVFATDTFTYTGDIAFETKVGSATTVGSFLASPIGEVISGLDAAFAALQLSKGNIGDGTATTTFFKFTIANLVAKGDFTITHDDGVAIFDDGTLIGGLVGPNSVKTTKVSGFDGGKLDILYVASNSDPSILKIDANLSPVPVPASLPLLASVLAGLGLLRSRRRKAA